MFRLSRYLQALRPGTDSGTRPAQPPALTGQTGPVVIWNLVRRCNLTCRHCYATSADKDFPGELDRAEIDRVMDDLYAYGVRVLILSGGEPLLHPDIFAIARRAKALGFYVGLSSNGTLIDAARLAEIAATGFDYVGISLDGLRETHDRIRRGEGAFAAALQGLRDCRAAGLKVGLRFTLTRDNAAELPALLRLMDEEDIDKFYLSHLNYAGRGYRNRGDDPHHRLTREAMDFLFETCWADVRAGRRREIVTGNNDADAVYLLHWAARRLPEALPRLRAMLRRWGGNASGVNIANIDNEGRVHPDTMWWDYSLGNVKERSFGAIWDDRSDPLMDGLKQHPRPLKGRCATCRHLDICAGNSRTRAWRLTGDPWSEDPGCYLTDAEIAETFGETPGRRSGPAEQMRSTPPVGRAAAL
jgi:Fe-coproporphyrin III synthase